MHWYRSAGDYSPCPDISLPSNLIAEAVCVGERKPRPISAILTLDMFVVELVHEDFGELQHYETSVHGFILDDFLRHELDHDQIFIYYGEILTCGLGQGLFDSFIID